MKNTQTWEKAVRWLLGSSKAQVEGCNVAGCQERLTIVVAGNASETTRLCPRHAIAWTESNLCKDFAQNNSGATLLALSSWLGERDPSTVSV
jgi:hypothetical protein